MNAVQKKRRGEKIVKQNLALRNEIWPDLDTDFLWNRKSNDGYTTIPRTMPQILQIMDSLAPKDRPVSKTYLSLWCRVFDESFINIQNPLALAIEAGFSKQRALTAWNDRIASLVKLGFIEAEKEAGQYKYILVYNPYIIIKQSKAKIPEKARYLALFQRAQEVGAKDLTED